MPEPATPPLTLEEAERRALSAAIAESLADPRPSIPNAVVRAEMLQTIARLRRELGLPPD